MERKRIISSNQTFIEFAKRKASYEPRFNARSIYTTMYKPYVRQHNSRVLQT